MITTQRPDDPIAVSIVAEVAGSLKSCLAGDPRFKVAETLCGDPEELITAAASAAVLVTRHHNRITAPTLRRLPSLRVIAQATSGIDNIDEDAASENGIRIVSTPGSNANAVAEYVLGQILNLSRSLPAYHREVTEGFWLRQDCASRHELSHYRLGIVGIGHVGTRVAAVVAPFGMAVYAYDPYLDPDEIERRGARPCTTLNELLEEISILSLHAPLTPETRSMIGAAQLQRLAAGSFLINAARGELVDLPAVLTSLTNGHLAGAACDVFDPEPAQLPDRLPPSLRLTPHIAGCTAEAKEGAGTRLYRAICEALDLEPMSGV